MNNYTEEIQPLFKLLRTTAFRFVVVRFNHYSLVRRLQSDLREQFPDRKFSTINTEKATYEEILKTFFEQKEGFFFLENFEDILKRDADSQGKITPEMTKNNQRRSSIAAGLNMRRDKLAKSPIAIVAFVFATAGEIYVRSLMEKMPDLWSFRSLLLDLKFDQEEQEVSITDFFQMQPTFEPLSGSTIGGSSQEEKFIELERLLAQVKETPATEINYLKNLYEQIAELQKETGKYDEAINTLDLLISFENEIEKTIWMLIEKSDILILNGNINNVISVLKKAHELSYSIDNILSQAIILQRLGDMFSANGNLQEALNLFTESNELLKKLKEIKNDDLYINEGFAISLLKIGEAQMAMGNFDKALPFLSGNNQIIRELYIKDKKNIAICIDLTVSSERMGDYFISIGNAKMALDYYKERSYLSEQLYTLNPQNQDYLYSFAMSHLKIGDTFLNFNDYSSSLLHYERYFELTKKLTVLFPNNQIFKRSHAISNERLGDIYFLLSHFDRALIFYKNFHQATESLINIDPQNNNFRNGLAISYEKLGATYAQLKDFKKAQLYFDKRLTIGKNLYESNPSNLDFKNGYASAIFQLALLNKINGKNKACISNMKKAQQIWKELALTSPNHSEYKKNLDQVQKELSSLSD